jgi:hypothetical protein
MDINETSTKLITNATPFGLVKTVAPHILPKVEPYTSMLSSASCVLIIVYLQDK